MGRKNSPSRRSSGCRNAPPLNYVRGPSLPFMASVEASPLGAVVCYAPLDASLMFIVAPTVCARLAFKVFG